MATRDLSKWSGNPYGSALGEADVMIALRETPERLRAAVERLTMARMASSYAPGKWTAAQVLVHLAQCEFIFGDRIRFALTQDGYTAQPMDQDAWLQREAGVDGHVAFQAYYAARQMNLLLFTGLTDADRAKVLQHPERGQMHVEWLLELLAGHERHHLRQLESIAAGGAQG